MKMVLRTVDRQTQEGFFLCSFSSLLRVRHSAQPSHRLVPHAAVPRGPSDHKRQCDWDGNGTAHNIKAPNCATVVISELIVGRRQPRTVVHTQVARAIMIAGAMLFSMHASSGPGKIRIIHW